MSIKVVPSDFHSVSVGTYQALFKEMDFVIQDDGSVTACPCPDLETVDQIDRDLKGAARIQAACDAINAWGGLPAKLTRESL